LSPYGLKWGRKEVTNDMPTWGELGNYTFDEIEQLHLTFGELENLSDKDLMKLAQEKLERFKKVADLSDPKNKYLVELSQMIIAGIIVNQASKAIDTVNLSDMLKALIKLINQFLR
jgi:hypothetical protein